MGNSQPLQKDNEKKIEDKVDFAGLFTIRAGKESDFNFILATFLKNLHYGSSFFNQVPKNIFMTKYHLVAEALVSSPKIIIRVACLPEDPDIILGYSLLSDDQKTLYFIYVKKQWRLKGIGRALIPKSPEFVAHLTKVGIELLKKFEIKPKFNPFF